MIGLVILEPSAWEQNARPAGLSEDERDALRTLTAAAAYAAVPRFYHGHAASHREAVARIDGALDEPGVLPIRRVVTRRDEELVPTWGLPTGQESLFDNTSLLRVLGRHPIKHVVFAGDASAMTLAATAIDAFRYDYRVWLTEELTLAWEHTDRDCFRDGVLSNFGKLVSQAAVLRQLQHAAEIGHIAQRMATALWVGDRELLARYALPSFRALVYRRDGACEYTLGDLPLPIAELLGATPTGLTLDTIERGEQPDFVHRACVTLTYRAPRTLIKCSSHWEQDEAGAWRMRLQVLRTSRAPVSWA